ncbi:Cytochrome P450 86B1 [Platanthera zijinensis]|uniref:noroxomaritidine synthase n=1 Tax=Platanthera zijinensis TaxID=2320716 RepID=A0AAP0BVG2_9ASPA
MEIFRPSTPELLIAILCFLVFLVHRFRKTRGELTKWPIVGMLPGLAVNLHRLHDLATEILVHNGCSYLFIGPWFSGMRLLITCDPANVNHVFNANFHNYPKGHEFSEIFDLLGDGIFNADDESWRSQRKKAQLLIAQPRFRGFAARCIRDKVDNSLLPLLQKVSEQGKIVDLQDIFLRLSFDITCSMVFGEDSASLNPNFTVVLFSKAMDDAMNVIMLRHAFPATWWKLMRRLNVGFEKRLAAARLVIDEFIAESISKRKQESYGAGAESAGGGGDSLLKAYIECAEAGDENATNKFLRDTTLSLMLAGRDTIGVALAWFFYLLCKNPNVEERLLKELRRGEAGEGVYLHAALCEALRLYPSVPFEAKGVAAEDTLPSGDTVKPGMQVLFSTYTMGRLEGVWGKDCREFLPERWITEQERLRHEPAYKFMSFNCGPRTCLGKELAFAELKATAAAVVKQFRMEIVEGHVVEPKLSIILQMRNGLKVRVKKRVNY